MEALKQIGKFKLYTKKKNAISAGFLYTARFVVPFDDVKRTIRVYLPSNYEFNNPSKRFKVMYMSDGQNMVDSYTTAYGEWDIDDHMEEQIKNQKETLIFVGIDCPKDEVQRECELAPNYKPLSKYQREGRLKGIVDEFLDFIIDTLKPYIDKHFYTLKERKDTGIGGSSMGGLMSAYGYFTRNDIFGFSLSFSPAFFLYHMKQTKNLLNKWTPDPKQYGKIFFYVGNKGFEKEFVKSTLHVYNTMLEKGFKPDQIAYLQDLKGIHHERFWSKHFLTALNFLIK